MDGEKNDRNDFFFFPDANVSPGTMRTAARGGGVYMDYVRWRIACVRVVRAPRLAALLTATTTTVAVAAAAAATATADNCGQQSRRPAAPRSPPHPVPSRPPIPDQTRARTHQRTHTRTVARTHARITPPEPWCSAGNRPP